MNGKDYVACTLSDSFAKRKNEINADILAMQMGFAPNIYYHNEEYTLVIMEFMNGPTLSMQEAQTLEALNQVAQALFYISRITLDMPENDIFAYIRQCYNELTQQQTSLSPLLQQAIEMV